MLLEAPGMRPGGGGAGVRWSITTPGVCRWTAWRCPAICPAGVAGPEGPAVAVPGIKGCAAPDVCGKRTGGIGADGRCGCIRLGGAGRRAATTGAATGLGGCLCGWGILSGGDGMVCLVGMLIFLVLAMTARTCRG
jgi:hypothetical protein